MAIRWKSRLRFGLKTLFAVVTLIAVWFGYYASQANSRRQAIAHVASIGGATWRKSQITTLPAANAESYWSTLSRHYDEIVCRLFGEALRKDIVALELSGTSISQHDLTQFKPLGELEWIAIMGSEIDDSAAGHLRSFKRLRWLDVSDTEISIDGVKQLSNLQDLEWLNVSRTLLAETDIATIQSMFPNAKIGFTSLPTAAASLEDKRSPAEGVPADAPSLWSALQANPYSNAALQKYLDAIGRSSSLNFPNWYISAVYRARRKMMEPLLVVQIYDGTLNGFNLGCLLVFDPKGKLLRDIRKERVNWSLGGPTTKVDWMSAQTTRIRADQLATSRKQILDLIDLTGDGFDEIPTERWDRAVGTINVRGDSTSIYTTTTSDIPCVLCVGFPNQPRQNLLVDLGFMSRNLVFRDLASRELFLQTPCYATTPTGGTLIAELPQRTLATFYWSEELRAYVGPTEGPDDTWIVIKRP